MRRVFGNVAIIDLVSFARVRRYFIRRPWLGSSLVISMFMVMMMLFFMIRLWQLLLRLEWQTCVFYLVKASERSSGNHVQLEASISNILRFHSGSSVLPDCCLTSPQCHSILWLLWSSLSYQLLVPVFTLAATWACMNVLFFIRDSRTLLAHRLQAWYPLLTDFAPKLLCHLLLHMNIPHYRV